MSRKENIQFRRGDDSRISLSNIKAVFNEFIGKYQKQTPKRLKIIDSFCLLCAILTIIPLAYCLLVGAFPMNSLLSGIFAPLGTLIFTSNLFKKY